MLKLEKSQYLNSILQLNYTIYEKKVLIQNCLFHKDLHVSIGTFSHKVYFFLSNLKKILLKIQNSMF